MVMDPLRGGALSRSLNWLEGRRIHPISSDGRGKNKIRWEEPS